MNGGQIIAQILKANGVQHLFTLCGGHIAPIYVEAEKSGIKVTDVRNEASAVFAADAMARISGIPGIAAVTAGPGVTNSITALKNAQMAQSPVVLLGGATATMLKGRGALQDIEQLSPVKSIVKFSASVRRLRDLGPLLRKAIKTAQSGTPGPVFVEIPVDLLYDEAIVREWYSKKAGADANWQERLVNWYIKRHVDGLFSHTQTKVNQAELPDIPSSLYPKASATHKLSALIQGARKPLMLIGSGAMLLPQKAQDLAEAVKKLGIPVYLSGMARGLLGRQNELQCLHERKKALREADLIILAGVSCDFRLDYGGHLGRKALKVAISRHKPDISKNIKPQLAVLADPALTIVQVASSLNTRDNWADWKKHLHEREQQRASEIARQAAEPVQHGMNPIALFSLLEQRLPQNSVLIADGGDFAATAAYTLRPRGPLAWLDPGAFGTLGVGGGFALSAALQYPDTYTWIIYGDGSAAYSLTEFDTFTKCRMRVCAIIGNNGSWEQIARDQVTMLGAATATQLPRSDYHLIAQAFGAAGERVETLETFEQSISHAIQSMDKGIPYVINAVIGSTEFRKGSISM